MYNRVVKTPCTDPTAAPPDRNWQMNKRIKFRDMIMVLTILVKM